VAPAVRPTRPHHNYPRLAEWASSASRVGILLFGLDLLAPVSSRAEAS